MTKFYWFIQRYVEGKIKSFFIHGEVKIWNQCNNKKIFSLEKGDIMLNPLREKAEKHKKGK